MNLKEQMAEFLGFATSQHELSLCIVPDSEIVSYIDFLKSEGFNIKNDILDFVQGLNIASDTIFVASEDKMKDVYDIAMQYPTGQISFFDTASSKTHWITPAYKDSRSIVLIAGENLSKQDGVGNAFLVPFGITYQQP